MPSAPSPTTTTVSAEERVFRQVEATAYYYPPLTYTELLTFYNDFIVGADPQSGQFFPLSQVNKSWSLQSARQSSILFAVGILPPATFVTGRLLDRTASIPTDGLVESTGEEQVSQAAASGAAGKDPVSGTGGRAAANHVAQRQTIIDAFKELYGREPTLEELQYAQAIAWLETSYGQGWKGAMVGSNNWGAVQCSKANQNAAGCIEYTDSYPDGTRYTVSFKSYETPKDGAKDLLKHVFTYRGTSGALADGDVMRASYEMRRGKYYGGFCPESTKKHGAKAAQQSFGSPDLNEGTAACAQEAISLHANTAKKIINDVAAANKDPWALGLGSYEAADAWWRNKEAAKQAATTGGAVAPDASSANKWKDQGSKNAQEAKKEEAKLSPLLSSDLGKALLAAQEAAIKATQEALDKMARTPPLAMLVNPASFSVKGEKIVQDGNWGRNGPIIEYWGDQQDKISGSGKIGAFFAMDTQNATAPGVTRWARNFSAAWQNFQSLYQLYRSNGALFLPDDTTQRAYLNLSLVGSVYIYYDNVLYIGSFDSFSITEEDTAPHTVSYSFEFTVRSSFLLDRTDDAYDYGIGTLLRTDVPATNLAGQPTTNQGPVDPSGGTFDPTEI